MTRVYEADLWKPFMKLVFTPGLSTWGMFRIVGVCSRSVWNIFEDIGWILRILWFVQYLVDVERILGGYLKGDGPSNALLEGQTRHVPVSQWLRPAQIRGWGVGCVVLCDDVVPRDVAQGSLGLVNDLCEFNCRRYALHRRTPKERTRHWGRRRGRQMCVAQTGANGRKDGDLRFGEIFQISLKCSEDWTNNWQTMY